MEYIDQIDWHIGRGAVETSDHSHVFEKKETLTRLSFERNRLLLSYMERHLVADEQYGL